MESEQKYTNKIITVFIDGENINHHCIDDIYEYINTEQMIIKESFLYCDFSKMNSNNKVWEKYCIKYNMKPIHVFSKNQKEIVDIEMSIDCIKYAENDVNNNFTNICICSDFRHTCISKMFGNRNNKRRLIGISTNSNLDSELFDYIYDEFLIFDSVKEKNIEIVHNSSKNDIDVDMKKKVLNFMKAQKSENKYPVNNGVLREFLQKEFSNFSHKDYCSKFSKFVETQLSDIIDIVHEGNKMNLYLKEEIILL